MVKEIEPPIGEKPAPSKYRLYVAPTAVGGAEVYEFLTAKKMTPEAVAKAHERLTKALAERERKNEDDDGRSN